jgi:hypothetical protein
MKSGSGLRAADFIRRYNVRIGLRRMTLFVVGRHFLENTEFRGLHVGHVLCWRGPPRAARLENAGYIFGDAHAMIRLSWSTKFEALSMKCRVLSQIRKSPGSLV